MDRAAANNSQWKPSRATQTRGRQQEPSDEKEGDGEVVGLRKLEEETRQFDV